MARAKPSMDAERVARYDKHIAAHPEIERKGAANPYTSVNGHMFSCLNKEGHVALRMSKDDKALFEEEYKTPPFISYNTVMKEYVNVPDEVFHSDVLFQKYLNISFDWVRSLKPKPTTRKPKK